MERPIPSTSLLSTALRVLGALSLGLMVLCSELDAAQFTLTWTDNSTNELGFRVERSSNGNTFTEVATVGANVVSFVDAGLPNATTYWYRLRAYNLAGNSGYSNVASGTTPPVLSNQPPTISNIANRSIYAGGTTAAIPFSVGDAETAAASLSVTVASSNTTLAPLNGILLGGSAAARTIQVTPAAGRTGSATITVNVSDGVSTTSDTFVLTVNAVGSGPAISAPPEATALTPGAAFTLSVSATGPGAVTYQWYFNDAVISGATASTLTIPIAQRSNAGAYHVVVTSGGVSLTSAVVSITASNVASTGKLMNLSSRGLVLTGDSLMIPGFVVAGTGNKRLLVRMVGPGLSLFGLTGMLPDPKVVLKRQTPTGFVDVATNLDWADGGAAASLSQAFSDVGAFGLADGSTDATLLLDLAPGVYSVHATDEVVNRTGLSMVEVYDADLAPGGARMANISTRGHLGTGNDVMITGFVIEDGPMTLLLRAVGPGLSIFSVPGTAANPRMDLYRRINDADERVAGNDNWGSSPAASYTEQVTEQVSAFGLPAGSQDAAEVVTLPPGVYTLISQGVGSTTGIALVELYAVP